MPCYHAETACTAQRRLASSGAEKALVASIGCGAGCQTRTDDPRFTRAVLYQLS